MINMALKLIGTNLNEQLDKYLSPFFIYKNQIEKDNLLAEVNI